MYEAIRRVLNALVTDLIGETHARVSALGATTLAEIRRAPERLAGLSEPMEARAAPSRSSSTRTSTTRRARSRNTRARRRSSSSCSAG